ncbi:hypothetical protein CRP01_22200 [Flavilitoribacter nigricans DSM 23189 = NBRC 102662]|uniref:Transporter n=1 Tax=Flavilitoribacter nigricans (strain ATCC 23147 / DSM 23189 / NBRC 102662 / NCIMB 1420 / SS-2) TaxID=1122177 RepID=A0A2D0N736_FLAN2|nr:hypothetical protein CRP01_22200 [Flavilitoribacter nigricans DSM 23189 = NBRC 102662]
MRYSQYDYFGTARSAAVAGSLGPLGADFSVISTNPAGIAWMRRSQFVITPMFNLYTGNTQLTNGNNSEISETASSLSLASLGLVFSGTSRNPNWVNVNFAMGFNRLADFNRETVYRGMSQGSIVNRFTELANSDFGLDEFESGLANDAGAFLIDNGTGFYFSDFDDAPGAVIEREQTITTSGGVNELSFAVSGNYDNRLLIGLGLGLPFVNYLEQKSYFESDVNNEVPAFEDLQYDENLTTTGIGFNAKLGIIYRVNQMVRVGAAIHTPTWFNLEDNFSTSMLYSYSEGGQGNIGSASSPDGNFSYKLATPWRMSGGVGFIFGRNGFISGELEWVNFANNKLGFSSFSEDEDIANRDISEELASSINLKVGGEYAFRQFRFRGGVSLRQPPYSNTDGLPAFNTQLSLGLGYSMESFFLDLAARRSMTEEIYRPYLTATYPEQVFNNTTNYTRILLTLGFRF